MFYENDYSGLHKRQVYPERCKKIRDFFHFLNSAQILQFLKELKKSTR